MAALPWITYLQRMVGRGHPTLSDTLNTPLRTLLSQSGYDPDASPFPGLYGPVFNIKAFGAVGDGVADDTAAIQAAIDAAIVQGGGVVFTPAGSFRITTPLAVTSKGVSIIGVGRSSRFVCAITGATAEAMIQVTMQDNYFLLQGIFCVGNYLTGASGNGHALALYNSGVDYTPAQVTVSHCQFEGFRGTSQDNVGASVPSCGIYAYRGIGLLVRDTVIYRNAMGMRLKGWQRARLHTVSIDECDNTGVHVTDDAGLQNEHLDMVQTTIGNCGAGGAQDGGVYLSVGALVTNLIACRFKNANPYLINGSTDVGGLGFSALTVKGCTLHQLEVADGHTAVGLSNGFTGASFEGNDFKFINTMTDAVGILVSQVAGGYDASGLAVRNNTFLIGNGGTIAAGVRLNVTSNKVVAPVIEGNTFGRYDATTGYTITSGVEVLGNCDAPAIRNNTFVAVTNVVITNAIRLVNGTITNAILENNIYRVFGGTITNEVSQSGGVAYLEIGRGGAIRFVSSGGTVGYIEGQELSADPAAPAGNFGRMYFKDNGTGKTQLVVRFPTGAVQIVATEP